MPDKAQEVRLQQNPLTIAITQLQSILDKLISAGFFEAQPNSDEIATLKNLLGAATVEDSINVENFYSCVNRAVSSNNIEGAILLRVSKFFTGLFAVFMGFLAVFLLTIGMNLGQVYMSMGCVVGSAVGPAALTILMETANKWAIAAGAIGGLIAAILGWSIQAQVEFGEVKYETLMSDWPWVVGNLCAIVGGTLIAGVGSLIAPDKNFKWDMLNDLIPLVDDVEPPKDLKDETDSKLSVQVKIAVWASVILTVILLVVWPIPMHLGAGVFTEGGFTIWVTLEMIWAILGGIVIILMPLYELVRTLTGKEKVVAKTDVALEINMPAAKTEVEVEI